MSSAGVARAARGLTEMPLLDHLWRRFRIVRRLERDVEQRERRSQQTTSAAWVEAARADRLARELAELGRIL